MKRVLLGFGSIFCPVFYIIAVIVVILAPFFVDIVTNSGALVSSRPSAFTLGTGSRMG